MWSGLYYSYVNSKRKQPLGVVFSLLAYVIKKLWSVKNYLIVSNRHIIDWSGHDLSFSDVTSRINTRGDSKELIIEDYVSLGTGVIALPRIKIGSIISVNSVIHKDIPTMVIAGCK